jgi:hypothetical protein
MGSKPTTSGPDPDTVTKVTVVKYFKFWIYANHFFLDPPRARGTLKLSRSPQPSKENIQPFKNKKISSSFLRATFAVLELDQKQGLQLVLRIRDPVPF